MPVPVVLRVKMKICSLATSSSPAKI
jgi:hypothetical protein